jgi:hypothetical protein
VQRGLYQLVEPASDGDEQADSQECWARNVQVP